MIGRLMDWLRRLTHRPGYPGDHDAARDDLDARLAEIAQRLARIQAESWQTSRSWQPGDPDRRH